MLVKLLALYVSIFFLIIIQHNINHVYIHLILVPGQAHILQQFCHTCACTLLIMSLAMLECLQTCKKKRVSLLVMGAYYLHCFFVPSLNFIVKPEKN